MNRKPPKSKLICLAAIISLLTLACNFLSAESRTATLSPQNTQTKTPTPDPIIDTFPSATASPDQCSNLSGELELQVLMGPAEVAGLEPVAIGTIPFSTVLDEGVYTVSGNGIITYNDTLEEAWGTYTVEFDGEVWISGECDSEGGGPSVQLDLVITTTGDQMVKVRSDGFNGDYPWSGSHEFNLTFPISNGASAEGEGWVFLLHIIN